MMLRKLVTFPVRQYLFKWHRFQTTQGSLQMMYTCKVCGSRQSAQFTKHAYEKTVVLVNCSGCKNWHIVADNLGWFTDLKGKRNIEEILAEKGESVEKLKFEGTFQELSKAPNHSDPSQS